MTQLCKSPTVDFRVGDECFSINIDELTPQEIEKKSYSEVIKRQLKINKILKSKDINGKLMRFRRYWRCGIGYHSWYCFYGSYSVCDNCGLIRGDV